MYTMNGDRYGSDSGSALHSLLDMGNALSRGLSARRTRPVTIRDPFRADVSPLDTILPNSRPPQFSRGTSNNSPASLKIEDPVEPEKHNCRTSGTITRQSSQCGAFSIVWRYSANSSEV